MFWNKIMAGLDWDLIQFLFRRGLFRKLLNYVVTTLQFQCKSSFLLGYPFQIYIDPSSRCTLHCPYCAVGKRSYPKPMMDMSLSVFKNIMDELGPYLLYAELYIKGEPLSNKRIYDMIAYCKKFRVVTLLSSNMQIPDEKGAERLVDSGLDFLEACVDGTTQESYEKYRVGGRLELALDNIRRIVAAKKRLGLKKPFVNMKYIVFRHNENEIEKAVQMSKDLGVDHLSFVGAVVGDAPLKPEDLAWLPQKEEYRLYDASGGSVTKSVGCQDIIGKCNLTWTSLCFDPSGRAAVCCRPIHPHLDHGEIRPGFFWNVWNGKRYRESRRLIRKGGAFEGADMTNPCLDCPAKASHNTVLPSYLIHEFL